MRPQFSEPEEGMMGEINMVPFIDIMLVLLIVFIITVPVMKHAINVQLPRATADKEIAEPQTVRLAVAADGGYFLGGEAVEDEQIIERLKAEAAREPQPDLHISGDRDVRYERVAQAMSAAQQAGLTRIGFVTDPEGVPEALAPTPAQQ